MSEMRLLQEIREGDSFDINQKTFYAINTLLSGMNLDLHPRAVDLLERQNNGGLSVPEHAELAGLDEFPFDSKLAWCVRSRELRRKGWEPKNPDKDMDEMVQLFRIRLEAACEEDSHADSRFRVHRGRTDCHPEAVAEFMAICELFNAPQLDECVHQAKIAALSNASWEHRDPKAIFDQAIDLCADRVVHTRSVGQRPWLPGKVPTFLELYLLSRLKKIPRIKDPRQELKVVASIDALRDRIRTQQFLLAIRESMGALERMKPEGEIVVLDAGCGATAVMGIYAALCSKRARVICLEKNSYSGDLAREIIAALHLEERVQVLHHDAKAYQPQMLLDLLISETMQAGLIHEPMTQILRNLAPHVADHGLILPQSVRVQANLLPVDDFENPDRFDRFCRYPPHEGSIAIIYDPKQLLNDMLFEISTKGLRAGRYYVLISTWVMINDQHTLSPYDALITHPQLIKTKTNFSLLDFITPEKACIVEVDGMGNQTVFLSYTAGGKLARELRIA